MIITIGFHFLWFPIKFHSNYEYIIFPGQLGSKDPSMMEGSIPYQFKGEKDCYASGEVFIGDKASHGYGFQEDYRGCKM